MILFKIKAIIESTSPTSFARHTASYSSGARVRKGRRFDKRVSKDLLHLYAAFLIVLKHSYEQVLEFCAPFCEERHLVCRIIRFNLIFRKELACANVLEVDSLLSRIKVTSLPDHYPRVCRLKAYRKAKCLMTKQLGHWQYIFLSLSIQAESKPLNAPISKALQRIFLPCPIEIRVNSIETVVKQCAGAKID